MRVIFHANYDHTFLRAKNGKPRAMVAYKAGPDTLTVPRGHGEAAIEAGAATEVKTPARRPVRGGPLNDAERGEESAIPLPSAE